MGSATIAAWIAHAAFWVLLVWGWAAEEISARVATIVLGLWFAGSVVLPYGQYGDGLFAPYVAVLDVALVFLVVKGDIKLT